MRNKMLKRVISIFILIIAISCIVVSYYCTMSILLTPVSVKPEIPEPIVKVDSKQAKLPIESLIRRIERIRFGEKPFWTEISNIAIDEDGYVWLDLKGFAYPDKLIDGVKVEIDAAGRVTADLPKNAYWIADRSANKLKHLNYVRVNKLD